MGFRWFAKSQRVPHIIREVTVPILAAAVLWTRKESRQRWLRAQPASKIGTVALRRMAKSDVKYRFSVDMASLKAE